MQIIAEFILQLVVDFFLSLFWWLILFPVVWLVSLPLIMVIALFRRDRYGMAVGEMLYSVHSFWREWGFWFCL